MSCYLSVHFFTLESAFTDKAPYLGDGRSLPGFRPQHPAAQRYVPTPLKLPHHPQLTLSGIIVGSDLKLLHEAKVDFDADLSHYGIDKGVLTNPAEGEVFAPVALWLEAVDLVLQRLKEQGAQFEKVKGVSGAGMQHGTVFWSGEAEGLLGGLDGRKTLLEQLGEGKGGKGAFSHPFSPNWQDASTQKQCDAFDKALGAPRELAAATGSAAHHVSLIPSE